jgi:hypothetical protein
MTTVDKWLKNLSEVVNQKESPTDIADELVQFVPLDAAKVNQNANPEALNDCLENFQFDWDNYDQAGGTNFCENSINDIKQMLADIAESNNYQRTFILKLIYDRKSGNDYEPKESEQKLDALNTEDAKREADAVRTRAPKALAENPEYQLLDTVVYMRMLDSSSELRHTITLAPEFGAYFYPKNH